jgi:D-alanyl-D-alanine endopeptidase (penicillin-binding protein 7)
MTTKRYARLRLTALLAALVAAGALLAVVQRQRHAPQPPAQVAQAPAAIEVPEETPSAEPAPPGTEVVPPEESETDHGPAAASPSGPAMSFARAAGLHQTPDPLRLNSSVALLVDQDSGEVMLQKNDQAVLPIASLTKLMTTMLVLEAKQPMDEMLTITQDDVDTERHSRSRLRPGTTLSREEALHLALMSSENRAAHALARYYPGGLPKMVEAMNARAKQLGMKNTSYLDPTGLSNRNQSTARDLALLVREAEQNPLMREFSTTPAHLATLNGRTLQYVNSNRLVRSTRGGWDIALQKTGYIVEAGRCLTMVVKEAGHSMIMVLLDADSNGTRVGDAERLRRYALAQWGVPDTTVAKAREQAPVRQVARAQKKAPQGKHKTEVAQKEEVRKKSAGRTTVARKPQSKGEEKTAHAKAGAAEKEKTTRSRGGRVRQTFAAAHDGQKS